MNGLSRTQSKRGTPLPPRSAAAAGRKQSTTPDPAEEDAKAEMQAKMEELQQKLQDAEVAHQEAQKQAAVLQVKLDESLKEQGMLEERVQEHTERNEELENEKKDSLRARREMEQIYESEKVAANKEKEEALKREDEMQQAMQRLKETLAQREIRAGVEDERRPFMSRQSSANARSNNPSPNPDGTDRQFAPASMNRSDSTSRSNSKLVMQKDKIIESLRLELADAEMKLIEVDHKGGGRLQDLQKEVYDLKMQNARLMEENEHFQVMLTEKTIAGDFHLAPPSNAVSRPPSRRLEEQAAGGKSLADELENHGDSEGEDGEQPKQLRAEINSLKDANKALTLYINNIISRLLQHDQFEAILDKTPDLMAGSGAASKRADTDKELPPPPPPQDDQPSLLQRAKSVMGGKPRPRPLSQTINTGAIDPPLQTPSLEPPRTEDPNTAPRVPIGRSNSKRAGSGHRRANSEWPAASLVSNMYRSGTPQTGPLSPPLGSPTSRNSFFGGNMRQLSSSSNVPTISETTNDGSKENNGPQRDSKMSEIRSNRNSMQSSVAAGGIEGIDNIQENGNGIAYERSNPSSPPRSTTSSGDKDGKGPSGAIMMGSKPRPLRLVQEAKDEDAAKKQANRGSWFGFMNQGLKAPTSGGTGIFGQRSNSGDPPTQ